MPAFHSLQRELCPVVDMRAVYITEAHAEDEWPIHSARAAHDGLPILLQQPRNSEERVAVARRFQAAFGFRVPLLVDPIYNPFDAVFAPWPLRFYVLHNGAMTHKAQPTDCTYSLAELRTHVLGLLGQPEDC